MGVISTGAELCTRNSNILIRNNWYSGSHCVACIQNAQDGIKAATMEKDELQRVREALLRQLQVNADKRNELETRINDMQSEYNSIQNG